MNGELKHPRVAEFFAGIGLVRTALEQESCQIVFANDFSERKRKLYGVNHDESEFICADIRDLGSDQIPDIDLATASFPCTDLSRGEQERDQWNTIRCNLGISESIEGDGRANTIARLAQVISERSVQEGLRRTLVTRAKRLEHLTMQRLDEISASDA